MSVVSPIREFMARVVPWPSPQGEGWVNLHWRSVKKGAPDAKPYWAGRAFKDIEEFLSLAAWCTQRDNIQDIYFCTSMQKQAGERNTKGHFKAARGKQLALSLKAIWLDVDVKEPPKGYATLPDALAAVAKFVTDMNLPRPSALIGTGGGLHVYWISNTPMTVAEWEPYAEGLKVLAVKHGLRCDAGVTTDAARILRVPGTFNYKLGTPRAVRVIGLQPAENDYDFKQSLAELASYGERSVPRKHVSTSHTALDGKPSDKFRALASESLSEGIQRNDDPLAWKPIAEGCAFIRDAIATSGKDYSQPMWNLTTLAATFMEDGHALAHRMGRLHPGYSQDSTEALWERKIKERADRGLGWPSCHAIQASGCGACASCPHFSKGKSPLNLAVAAAHEVKTPASLKQEVAIEEADLMLPEGFVLDDEGFISKLEPLKGRGGDAGETVPVRLFHKKVSLPVVEAEPFVLSFTVNTDKDNTARVSIKSEEIINGADMWSKLQKQGLLPHPRQRADGEEFLMSWLSKIQDAKEAAKAVPFGWWRGDDGQRHGFVYGGIVMKDDGTEGPAGYGDRTVRKLYEPVGDVKAWFNALKLITDQKRPELEAIVAAAFAAPLMVTPAEYSCLLSAWGPSGAFKSTAVKVGAAVWGHPKKTKEVTLSTARSVIHKMGEIKNLPLYWDEIKDKKAQQNVFDVFFTGTEGIGPSRLTSSIELRDRGDWQTMLVICSNISFVDFLAATQTTTDAGIFRAFEYITNAPPPDAAGKISSMDASRLTQELETNFGGMGMKYAKMLATAPHDIDEFTREVVENFGREVNAQAAERYWVATCGTLIAGARLANELGATFNIPAMHDFLLEQYYENRKRRKLEATEGGTVVSTEEILSGFLRQMLPNTLYTDTFPQRPGKPPQITIISAPRQDSGKGIKVQWAVKDNILRFSRTEFREYLQVKDIAPSAIMRGLREHFGATEKPASLAANTPYVVGQEHLVIIPVKEGSALWPLMVAHRAQSEEPNAVSALQSSSQQKPQPLQAV